MQKMIRCFDHYGKMHALPPEQFIIRASIYGVLRLKNQMLMVRERWERKWEFPGGGVKPYETLEETLQREFKEETGILVAKGQFITFQEDFFFAKDRNEGWHSLRFFYNVSQTGGNLIKNGNGQDIFEASFLSKNEINRKNTKLQIHNLLTTVIMF